MIWDMIGAVDYRHGHRTENDSRYSKIREIYRKFMDIGQDRLRTQYFRTLHETRLGSMTHEHRVIDYHKDRQIYLLYKDGVVFEDFHRYPEIISIFENV